MNDGCQIQSSCGAIYAPQSPLVQLCEATIPCDAAWLEETPQYCILVHVKHLL